MYCGSSNSTSMLRAAVGFKSGKEMEISPFSSVFFLPLSFIFPFTINRYRIAVFLKTSWVLLDKLDFCCIMGIVLLLIFDV